MQGYMSCRLRASTGSLLLVPCRTYHRGSAGRLTTVGTQNHHKLRPRHRTCNLVLNTIMASSTFTDRKYNKLVLFDVDGPLTLARQVNSFDTSSGLSIYSDYSPHLQKSSLHSKNSGRRLSSVLWEAQISKRSPSSCL